jgi:hypothetical protein
VSLSSVFKFLQSTKPKHKYRFVFPAPFLALHCLSIIHIVEFVCLRVQLLLVTLCSFAIFFPSNPSAPPHLFPSASHARRPPWITRRSPPPGSRLLFSPCLVCPLESKKKESKKKERISPTDFLILIDRII